MSPKAKAGMRRRPPGSPDVLSVVEAAYSIDTPLRDWTFGMLQAADRTIGAGLGGFACTFRATPEKTLGIDTASAAALGVPDEVLSAIFAGLTQAPPGWLLSYFS